MFVTETTFSKLGRQSPYILGALVSHVTDWPGYTRLLPAAWLETSEIGENQYDSRNSLLLIDEFLFVIVCLPSFLKRSPGNLPFQTGAVSSIGCRIK